MADASSRSGGSSRNPGRNNNSRTGDRRPASGYRGDKPYYKKNNDTYRGERKYANDTREDKRDTVKESSYRKREPYGDRERSYSSDRPHSYKPRRFEESDNGYARDRKPYGNREGAVDNRRNYGEKRPYGEKRFDRENKPAYADRKSYGEKRFDREDKPAYADRNPGAYKKNYARPEKNFVPPKKEAYVPKAELIVPAVVPAVPQEQPVFENKLYGKNPVWEALKAGRMMEKLYIAEGIEDEAIEGILGIARREKVSIVRVPRSQLDELVPGAKHQGLVAELPAMDYTKLDVLVSNAFAATKNPLFILLDEVQDPHNLGAVIRTADCAGANGVVVLEHRAVGLTATVAKVSAGALEHMPVAKVTNLVRAIELLQQKGVTVIGADAEGTSCYGVDMKGPTALVIGNEGVGIRRLVREQCDLLAGIPLKGHVDSLNASVAAAVLMFEAVRQRQEV